MTTGRINQVTIVRRLRPTARFSGRKSSLSYWVGGHEARVAALLVRLGAGLAAGHICFPLLNSPERCRQARAGSESPVTPPRRPKRRPAREVQPCGIPNR
jgi:hypothetical protein